MYVTNSNASGFSVKAWQGDAKTMIAFNFSAVADVNELAGFSIFVEPVGQQGYYLWNNLVLPHGAHAVVSGEATNSSANAPFQKFRWLHVPGNIHQGENVFYGKYTYTVTPRYFDANALLTPINTTLSVSVDIQVGPFATDLVELGFTRGFTQSQAFTHHFGNKALFQPAGRSLIFDTGDIAATNSTGQTFTFLQEYVWAGFTARQKIFDLLDEILTDNTLTIDVFAYDLNEPDLCAILLKLASEGRIRVILDNAALHTKANSPEDAFEQQFKAAAKLPAAILRGKFGRFAHDKEFVIYKNAQPLKVLTGSTNFSVTGMYVNSNHVILFKDPGVAAIYAAVFQEAWISNVSESFNKSQYAEAPYDFEKPESPEMSITFSPHPADVALDILNKITNRVKASTSSVLFAVMDISSGGGPVFPALQQIHADQNVFSYGISDAPGAGIYLYKPGNKSGVLVGGKPGKTVLPPPFDIEKPIFMGHQVHNKFIICDFNTDQAVVYCGSSNLALGGEGANGDNLIQINDTDTATVFALEAVALVDHFDFRNANEAPKQTSAPSATRGEDSTPPLAAPDNNILYLYNNDSWAKRYFDANDLHCEDRILFGM
ncbi:phospholipase D-like domain-containing protein [Mucilaginibacter sp.]|uniref:phospholipase D-like domain-containing protein n=1 Tax=Mucilaginibacter sp. TaxID=1882438 RepID=UPI00284F7553|nr:phospholipase D-like domain-containing protein [Mucilaginibacter sp.]MDR3693749.1 phospholipase D-like domain-containing protein [Mucilaginibacter sp.]